MSIFLGNRKVVIANQNISKIDTTKFLKKDGSDNMLANLDLGNYAIENLKTYPENNKQAASKKYVDDESAKLLDLDANRQMKGDLDLNDNSIIGLHDISADNSAPTKKYVKDELAKRDTKITQNENQSNLNANRNLTMTNDINVLKARSLYSHYSSFMYQNPVANVYKTPYSIPAGFPGEFFWLSPDYNEDTKLTILALNADSDTVLPTTNVNLSFEAIMYNKSGGFNSKVFMSGKNIHSYRVGNDNAYYFTHPSFTFKIKDFHSNFSEWCKFQLKIAVPWSGNETRITFFVTYFKIFKEFSILNLKSKIKFLLQFTIQILSIRILICYITFIC